MISIIVHGGAWDIPENEIDAHRSGCSTALNIGWKLLQQGACSLDVVEKVIRSLEDDETFDAGSGSHLNAIGQVELDASMMDGKTFRCGAVAGVRTVRNPISLARKVLEESEHVLLVGEGAERFAMQYNIDACRPEELVTPREQKRWEMLKHREDFNSKDAFRKWTQSSDTVGAVALDSDGNICVGTSTGGTLNKYPGRVGDSPLIGCGTYADNSIGGVSVTGWGEAIIKVVLAKTIIDQMEQNGCNAQAAAEKGIALLQKKAEGFGGVIVMNNKGHFGIARNTPKMARAFMNSDMREPVVAV
jgi:beta-aspartyl-peptidase (threonine type)